MTNIIGVVGRLGHGKTTFARMVAAEDPRIEPLAFADALKRDAINLMNQVIRGMGKHDRVLDPEQLEKDKAVFRPFLQWYGTDFVRNYLSAETHWVDVLSDYMRDQLRNGKGAIVHDVRFQNEVDAIRDLGGSIIRVKRDDAGEPSSITRGKNLTLVGGTDVVRHHESEQGADRFEVDETITNTTLSELHGEARRVFGTYFEFYAPHRVADEY